MLSFPISTTGFLIVQDERTAPQDISYESTIESLLFTSSGFLNQDSFVAISSFSIPPLLQIFIRASTIANFHCNLQLFS